MAPRKPKTSKAEKQVEEKTPIVDSPKKKPTKPVVDRGIKTEPTTDRGPVVLGAGILIMGVLLLAGRLLHIPFGDFLWPFIFIVPGALVFLSAITSESSSGEGLAILGGILGVLGLVFLMQSITGFWASWAYIWALIAPTSIGLSQMVYGNMKKRDTIATSGWKLTKIGLSIFAVGFIFFELVLGISGFGLAQLGLPVFPLILIMIGGFILVRSFVFSK